MKVDDLAHFLLLMVVRRAHGSLSVYKGQLARAESARSKPFSCSQLKMRNFFCLGVAFLVLIAVGHITQLSTHCTSFSNIRKHFEFCCIKKVAVVLAPYEADKNKLD